MSNQWSTGVEFAVGVCCASCHSHDLEGGTETFFQRPDSSTWIACFLCARCRHTLEDSEEGAIEILRSLAIEFHSPPDGAGVYHLARAS